MDYYVSELGGAASLDVSTLASPASIAQFQADQDLKSSSILEDGDYVYFSDVDGDLSPVIIYVGGSEGSKIVYRSVLLQSPKFVSSSTSGSAISVGLQNTDNVDYIDVIGFDTEKTNATGNVPAIRLDGLTSGSAGNGFTVQFIDCSVSQTLAGDGFSLSSQVGAEVEGVFIRCTATNIGNDGSGAQHQGYTAHEQSKIKLLDCDAINCKNAILCVTDTLAYWKGGTITANSTNAYDQVKSSCVTVLENVTINIEAGATNAKLFDTDADSSLDFINCPISVAATSTSNLVNDGNVRFLDGSSLYIDTDQFIIDLNVEGSLELNGSSLSFGPNRGSGGEARVIRLANSDSSNLYILGCDLDFENFDRASGSNLILADASPSSECEIVIVGNVIKNSDVSGNDLVSIGSGILNRNFVVANNVFVNCTNVVRFEGAIGSSSTFKAYNNIFHDCVDPFVGSTVGALIDYNVYSGTTPNHGDTNGTVIADPLFRSATDYRLAANSPLLSGAYRWWLYEDDISKYIDLTPPTDGNGVPLDHDFFNSAYGAYVANSSAALAGGGTSQARIVSNRAVA